MEQLKIENLPSRKSSLKSVEESCVEIVAENLPKSSSSVVYSSSSGSDLSSRFRSYGQQSLFCFRCCRRKAKQFDGYIGVLPPAPSKKLVTLHWIMVLLSFVITIIAINMAILHWSQFDGFTYDMQFVMYISFKVCLLSTVTYYGLQTRSTTVIDYLVKFVGTLLVVEIIAILYLTTLPLKKEEGELQSFLKVKQWVVIYIVLFRRNND